MAVELFEAFISEASPIRITGDGEGAVVHLSLRSGAAWILAAIPISLFKEHLESSRSRVVEWTIDQLPAGA